MSINEREKALENKYIHDQQKFFRIEARTCKLVGLWAAEKLSLSAEEAALYAKDLVAENMHEAGFGDIKRKMMKDFEDKGLDISSHMIDVVLEQKLDEAAIQIENDVKAG